MAGLDAAAVQAIYDALITHPKQLGLFGHSSKHEPESLPGKGITFAMTEGTIGPAPSGVAATSLAWRWHFRLYAPWSAKTADSVDPALTAAAVAVMASLAGDLDLTGAGAPAGLVRDLDLLGSTIDPGYMAPEGTKYRTRDITVDVIINDAYAQGTGAA